MVWNCHVLKNQGFLFFLMQNLFPVTYKNIQCKDNSFKRILYKVLKIKQHATVTQTESVKRTFEKANDISQILT